MSSKRALIIGITGQDGAYLAKHLIGLGYQVHGTSREAGLADTSRLKILGVADKVVLHSMNLADSEGVKKTVLETGPDEIYNLGGQTSVGLSFERPVETLQSGVLGTTNILEVLRSHRPDIRLFNASSGECFGELDNAVANESSTFRPRSPYAVAKAAGFWQTANNREAYGLYCVSGLLFNHESPLRPERFVTRKIIRAAVRSSEDQSTKVKLGDLDVSRDWGWAEEYVAGMHLMLHAQRPDDFVLATGESMSLHDFTRIAFELVGCNYLDHVETDKTLFRPHEIRRSTGDPSKANRVLGWKAKKKGKAVVEALVEAELRSKD